MGEKDGVPWPPSILEVGVQLVESSGESQDMTLTVLTATPTERGPCVLIMVASDCFIRPLNLCWSCNVRL